MIGNITMSSHTPKLLSDAVETVGSKHIVSIPVILKDARRSREPEPSGRHSQLMMTAIMRPHR